MRPLPRSSAMPHGSLAVLLFPFGSTPRLAPALVRLCHPGPSHDPPDILPLLFEVVPEKLKKHSQWRYAVCESFRPIMSLPPATWPCSDSRAGLQASFRSVLRIVHEAGHTKSTSRRRFGPSPTELSCLFLSDHFQPLFEMTGASGKPRYYVRKNWHRLCPGRTPGRG